MWGISYHDLGSPSPSDLQLVWPGFWECLIQAIIMIVYFCLVFLFPKGFVNVNFASLRDQKKSEDSSDNSVRPIKDQIISAQQSELSAIKNALGAIPSSGSTDYGYLKDKILKAIDYGIGRHDWYERQRLVMFQSILAFSSVIFTIMGLLISVKLNNYSGFPIFALAIGVISLAALFRAVYLYNTELDSDRPYRLVSDIRAWFFKYNLPDSSDFDFRNSSYEKMAENVLLERKKFYDRNLENIDLEHTIREDMEQVFILQILQRYKHEALSKLRWLLSYYISFFGLEVFVASIFGVFGG